MLVFTAPTQAVSIPVSNPSFEALDPLPEPFGGGPFSFGPLTDWVLTGVSGLFRPNSIAFHLPLPDGDQVAYSNGGNILKVLTTTLQNSTTYILQIDVGKRLDCCAFPPYKQIPQNSRQNSRPSKQVDQSLLGLGSTPFRFKFPRCCL